MSLPTSMGGLSLSHELNKRPTTVVAAWSNEISTLVPSGDCAFEPFSRGFLRASADDGRRLITELTAISDEAADSLH